MRSAQDGFTLAVVLVTSLALTALLTSTIALAHIDARIQSFALQRLQARVAADSVLRLIEYEWNAAFVRHGAIPADAPRLPAGVPWPVQVMTYRTIGKDAAQVDIEVRVGEARVARWVRLSKP